MSLVDRHEWERRQWKQLAARSPKVCTVQHLPRLGSSAGMNGLGNK